MQKRETRVAENMEQMQRSEEDIVAVCGEVRQELGEVHQEVGEVRQDVEVVCQDVEVVRQEVGEVPQEVGEVRQEVRHEIGEVRQRVQQEIVMMRKFREIFDQSVTKTEASVKHLANRQSQEEVSTVDNKVEMKVPMASAN